MTQQAKYKLRISYQIEKVMVDTDHVIAGVAPREDYTGERISIDTNMDLTTGAALTEVLRLIEEMNSFATAANAANRED